MKNETIKVMVALAIALFPVTASYGSNDPITKEVKLPSGSTLGEYTEVSSETFDYQVVSATIVYLNGLTDTSTQSTTIMGKFASAAEAALSYTTGTGNSAESVVSTTLNSEWVSTGVDTTSIVGETSSAGFHAYTATSPWIFKSWIVGPPPTDNVVGTPAVQTNSMTATSKLVTTTTTYNWSLRWIEEK